jgi:hypothetical protein
VWFFVSSVSVGTGEPAEVEEDDEEHRLFAQIYHVDQPGARAEGQANSGDGLRHKQARVDLGWREDGS